MTAPFTTPDGITTRCPGCGGETSLELADPPGVGLCPRCGRLFHRICEDLGANPGQVTLSSSLTDDLGADSLDVAELLMTIEEELGIHIPEDRAKDIKTVGEAIAAAEALAGHGR